MCVSLFRQTTSILYSACFLVLLNGCAIIQSHQFYNQVKPSIQQLDYSDQISWIRFNWVSDTLSGTVFEHAAIFIPCQLKGIQNPVTFQFDLGSDLTGVYENPFRQASISQTKSYGHIKIGGIECKTHELELNFPALTIHYNSGYVFDHYGDSMPPKNQKDTFHIGTIGRDIFRDKVLIIDYPEKRIGICNEIPKIYDKKHFFSIKTDLSKRIIIPCKLNNKKLNLLFDTGSSVFKLITHEENILKFPISEPIDSLEISSWGHKHHVTGHTLLSPINILGRSFKSPCIYVNHSPYGIDKKTDAVTGNALFKKNTLIIDLKKKRMGVF